MTLYGIYNTESNKFVKVHMGGSLRVFADEETARRSLKHTNRELKQHWVIKRINFEI